MVGEGVSNVAGTLRERCILVKMIVVSIMSSPELFKRRMWQMIRVYLGGYDLLGRLFITIFNTSNQCF